MPSSSQTDDMQLIQRMVRKDQNAMAELYQQYGTAVFSLARRVLNNDRLAEEVTQDVFLKAWKNADLYNPQRGPLINWLLTMTRNTAIDLLRKEQRRPTDDAMPLDRLPYVRPDAAMSQDNWLQDNRLIRQLMAQLPDEQQRVIELAFYGGMTHSDIAEHTNQPLGTVKTRLRLGLDKLRMLWFETEK